MQETQYSEGESKMSHTKTYLNETIKTKGKQRLLKPYTGGSCLLILATQEAEIRKSAWANSLQKLTLKKPFTKKGLVEFLKMKALSSSPSTTKKKDCLKHQERSGFSYRVDPQ
jgi:hypothetical protein